MVVLQNKRITRILMNRIDTGDIDIIKKELSSDAGFIHGTVRADWRQGGISCCSFNKYEDYIDFSSPRINKDWKWEYIRKAWVLNKDYLCKQCTCYLACTCLGEFKPILDIEDRDSLCYSINKVKKWATNLSL